MCCSLSQSKDCGFRLRRRNCGRVDRNGRNFLRTSSASASERVHDDEMMQSDWPGCRRLAASRRGVDSRWLLKAIELFACPLHLRASCISSVVGSHRVRSARGGAAVDRGPVRYLVFFTAGPARGRRSGKPVPPPSATRPGFHDTSRAPPSCRTTARGSRVMRTKHFVPFVYVIAATCCCCSASSNMY
jgi:hypothetical protein